MIFGYCENSDHFSIINVCKNWRRIYFKYMAKKYEKSMELFKKGRKNSKKYKLQELILVDQKSCCSYAAKDINDNVSCRVDVIKIEKNLNGMNRYLKKIHFLSVFDHVFFPRINDIFFNLSGLNIVTQITDGIFFFFFFFYFFKYFFF